MDDDTKAARSERAGLAQMQVNPNRMQGDVGAGRQSGRHALLERVNRMRLDANRLEALAMAIPENFPLDADAGLWALVMNTRG